MAESIFSRQPGDSDFVSPKIKCLYGYITWVILAESIFPDSLTKFLLCFSLHSLVQWVQS